jgi:hypothetical protein
LPTKTTEEAIASQREAPGTLAGLIEGVSAELLGRQPAPGRWSVRAILAHMAEDELTSSWRYRQMIEHNGTTLQGFDQDEWARLGQYESWTAQEALEMFRLLREANLRNVPKAHSRGVAALRHSRGARPHHGGRTRPPHGRARRQPHCAGESDAGAG